MKPHIGARSALLLASLSGGGRAITISRIICHMTDAKKSEMEFLFAPFVVAYPRRHEGGGQTRIQRSPRPSSTFTATSMRDGLTLCEAAIQLAGQKD